MTPKTISRLRDIITKVQMFIECKLTGVLTIQVNLLDGSITSAETSFCEKVMFKDLAEKQE